MRRFEERALDDAEATADAWEEPQEETPTISGTGRVVRFIATLKQSIKLQSYPGLAWKSVVPLATDPFGEVTLRPTPYVLETGKPYELLFITRNRTVPSRAAAVEVLRRLGFPKATVMPVKRVMRLPGRDGLSLALWLGVARYEGPRTVTASDDPVFFSRVAAMTVG